MIPLRVTCCVLLVLLGLALNVALAGEPLFSDDFRDLNNWDITGTLDIGSKSAPKGPRWTLADGWLRPVKVPDLKEGEEVYHVALAKWDSPADCTVRCTVRRRPGMGSHGVVLRAKDAGNCLAARITTMETIELVQFADGKEHVLASVNGYLPPGESPIEVRAYGPRVSIVLNGMEVLSYDKVPAAGGTLRAVFGVVGRSGVWAFLCLGKSAARRIGRSSRPQKSLLAVGHARFGPHPVGNAHADGRPASASDPAPDESAQTCPARGMREA